MYTYYALSSALGKDPAVRRKYLWWSRYLTQFQMFQFVTNMAQVRPGGPNPESLGHSCCGLPVPGLAGPLVAHAAVPVLSAWPRAMMHFLPAKSRCHH